MSGADGVERSVWEDAFYPGRIERVAPASVDELADIVRAAEASHRVVIPAGAGNQAYLGNPPPRGALIVSTERLARIVRYEPGDFTVGVEAGLPVADLRRELVANGQDLMVDAPLASRGTVGGLVATALPGPRLARTGSLRSAIIGLEGLRGGGRRWKAGGMVVKNVAGYDVAKFVTGSLGTTGFITRANFKLRPLPQARSAGVERFESAGDAWAWVAALLARRLEPAACAVFSPQAARDVRGHGATAGTWEVAWLLEGNRELVDWSAAQVDAISAGVPPASREPVEEPELGALLERWCACDRPGDAVEPPKDLGIVRLGTLPTRLAEATSRIEARLVDLGAAPSIVADPATGQAVVRWTLKADTVDRPVPEIAEVLDRSEGHGWLVYLPPHVRAFRDWLLLDHRQRVAVLDLVRRFLAVFDPAGIFCPRRVSRHGVRR